MSEPRAEIQTCTGYRGPGMNLWEYGGVSRHRWHCLDCDEHGPAEVDGARCKWQLAQHIEGAHQ